MRMWFIVSLPVSLPVSVCMYACMVVCMVVWCYTWRYACLSGAVGRAHKAGDEREGKWGLDRGRAYAALLRTGVAFTVGEGNGKGKGMGKGKSGTMGTGTFSPLLCLFCLLSITIPFRPTVPALPSPQHTKLCSGE